MRGRVGYLCLWARTLKGGVDCEKLEGWRREGVVEVLYL